MQNPRSTASTAHKDAATEHKTCADRHLKAAACHDNNKHDETQASSKSAMKCCDTASKNPQPPVHPPTNRIHQ